MDQSSGKESIWKGSMLMLSVSFSSCAWHAYISIIIMAFPRRGYQDTGYETQEGGNT